MNKFKEFWHEFWKSPITIAIEEDNKIRKAMEDNYLEKAKEIDNEEERYGYKRLSTNLRTGENRILFKDKIISLYSYEICNFLEFLKQNEQPTKMGKGNK